MQIRPIKRSACCDVAVVYDSDANVFVCDWCGRVLIRRFTFVSKRHSWQWAVDDVDVSNVDRSFYLRFVR